MIGWQDVDWHSIHQFQSSNKLNNLLAKFENIFTDELGTVKDVKAHIQLNQNSEPKFHKAPMIPMALTKSRRIGQLRESYNN